MLIIVLGFTIDVAIRAIKLAILRLISPIPIISYITPGSEKDGAFGNWAKTLMSTYLDLFIRLVIIYFGAYLIVTLSEGNFSIWQESTSFTTSLLSTVFVIIGILVFMKQAPKFFKDMLGLKGDGHLFSGIGSMLGGAALIGGITGSIAANATTSFGEHREQGHGLVRSGISAVGSGIVGGLGGTVVGARALATADKNKAGAVFSAMQRRNAIRQSGSTLWGRGIDKFSSAVTGASPVDRMDTKIEAYNDFSELYKRVASKADVDDNFIDPTTGMTVKALKEYSDRTRASGASQADQQKAEERYKAAQENLINAVMRNEYAKYTKDGKESSFSRQIRRDYDMAMQTARGANLDLREINNAKDFKIASFDAADEAHNLKHSYKYKSRKQNQKFSNNKH